MSRTKAPRIFTFDSANTQTHYPTGPVIEVKLLSDSADLVDRRLTLELTYDDAQRLINDLTGWLEYGQNKSAKKLNFD